MSGEHMCRTPQRQGPLTVGPLPRGTAWRSVVRCTATSLAMLGRRQIRWPRQNVGRLIKFADGTTSVVYRETTVDREPRDPCVLVVAFRLRGVHGRGHWWFRTESWLNTPLFVGFPGFVSKLWLAHDEHETYRGVYEWDGAGRAEHYARALWRVLALVCEPGSIDYRVLPGTRRDVLNGPSGPSASPIGTSDPADGRLVAMCWQGATPSRGAGE